MRGVPGQALAAQREALGWSVEQVADQLKLAVRQVIALEAGDYAALPSPAVTRGFVRAYAKLVKVDPAPLVAQIAMETEPAPDTSAVTANRRPTPASFSESKFPSHGKRSSLPLGWIAGPVVVVVAAAAAWHFGLVPGAQRGETAVTSVTAPAANGVTEVASGNAVEPLQNPAVPLISVPGPGAAASAPPAAANNAAPGAVVNVPGTTATGAPPATVPAAPATPAAAPAAPAATTAPAAAPAGANALVLSVSQDSWIEVRPAKGGAPLLSRLVKAGSTETVNVEQPVRMTVGNPAGVTATLRGAAVALPAVPGKTLSRVNLQ
ncbi:helix-turn-helix domain-containing protein [Massilia phosphatilytica]